MFPPIRPYSVSIWCGPITCRPMIESVKPGATASSRSTSRSAYASSSAVCGAPAYWWGTHWVNALTTCLPSGASVRSNTDGMQMSANGRLAGRPATASW